MKILNCKILDIYEGLYDVNYFYGVFDGDMVVSTGVSSNLGFVEFDAGGYHTKEKFDKLYPDGWSVTFDF